MSPLKRKEEISYTTIQSDPEGQFGRLVQHVENMPDFDRRLEAFKALEGPKHKLDFVDVNFLNCVELRPLKKAKDSSEADKARIQGNEAFKAKKFSESLKFYNRAVIRAKKSDQVLALSLANRSAALLHLGKFKLAVNDIQLAFASNYPQEKRFKLYLRLAKCYAHLGETAKAKCTLKIAESLENDLESVRDVATAIETVKAKLDRKVDYESRLRLEKVHRKIPGLSSKLKLESNDKEGRFLTASEAIEAGETVSSESAFASVVYPERAGSHCQLCLKRFYAAIPCAECAGVAFCSLECRDAADFHKSECDFLELLGGFGCSQVARLALRILTSKSPSFFKDREKRLDRQDDSYARLFNLVANNESRWPRDDLRRTLMAGILLKLLLKCGYLNENVPRGDQLFFGSLLLRHLQVLQFNAHEIYEVVRGHEVKLKPSKSQSIALGVFPAASYFNHSCRGDLARIFDGSRMTLKALRPLNKGQKVNDNYGPTFYFKEASLRRLELNDRYWFHCECDACKAKWPLLEKLPKECEGIEHVGLVKAQRLMDKGKVEEAIKVLLDHVKAHEKGQPSEESVRMEDKLRTCFANFGSVFHTEVVKNK